jgi:predicted DNA-binding transcriptional regulator YafY
MKAERLLAILTILQNRDKVSAASLAEELGVSVRTIYRDIDALALAGLPVYGTAGRDGGLSLVEGFSLDRQLLDSGEVNKILAGLAGLAGVLPDGEVATLREKFSLMLKQSADRGLGVPTNHIFIELTPSRREKRIIETIERSIVGQTVVCVAYTDGSGRESSREIEPLALVFVWQSWYVWAWCRLRENFRLFKVSRVLSALPTQARRRAPPVDIQERPWSRSWESEPFDSVEFTADRRTLSRLGEYFDLESVCELTDGRLKVSAVLPIDEWIISFLMGLPGDVDVLAPASLRETIRERARRLAEKNN